MPLELSLRFETVAALSEYWSTHFTQGTLLYAAAETPTANQFDVVALRIALPEKEVLLAGEVLQIIPGLGIAVQVKGDLEALTSLFELGSNKDAELVEEGEVVEEGEAPEDSEVLSAMSLAQMAEPEVEIDPRAPMSRKPTASPISWPVEKLQAEWHHLSMADKVRVAKYGQRPARGFVLKLQDKALQHVLLSNPHISSEEVAALAGFANLDPALLKRILGSPEWMRHTAIARNLLCHPKVTLSQVTRLVDRLPEDELLRLTRTGKVRSSVKRIIMKKVEQRRSQR
jgi:hypothetical protein